MVELFSYCLESLAVKLAINFSNDDSVFIYCPFYTDVIYMLNLHGLLNPKSGYIKIDAYLLILCHVISDVKLSTVSVFQKLRTCSNTQIIQKTMSKPHLNVGELLRLNKHHFKPSLFLVFICVFRSLNCDKNGLRHKYFSVKVMFSNYFVTKYRLPMLS